MAQETLKITITADNQQAVKNIQETVTATTKLGTAFKTLPSTSNQATNALTNLSRVAQDAPYGFIGIANNLNPLLESFQRLSKEAGGSGAALKAMAGSLMGPAGIGLALGAVSSIIVAFGPKIADYIKGISEATKADDKFAKGLSDASAKASETGIRLQAYLTISESANVSEQRRSEALKSVITELSKVNSAYALTITNVDEARKAVNLYTQALIAQAVASRYIDEIAIKTIALRDANKKIIETGREYYKTLEMSKNMSNGYSDASIVQAGAISKAKDANIEARKEAINLKDGIVSLNKELLNTYTASLNNPFFLLDKGAKQLATTTKEVADNIQKIGKQARPITQEMTAPVLMERGAAPTITAPTGNAPLGGRTSGFNAISATRDINEQAKAQALLNMQLAQTQEITNLLAPAFNSVIQAMVMGEDVGLALEQAFKQIVIQLISMVAQALLFKAIMAGLSGGTSEIGSSIGSGLGMLFGGNSGGQFVLKGQDLLLATNRAQKASNLKGQSISLA
jgi:hypothetical protein